LFQVDDFPATAADDYAEIRVSLERRGTKIGSYDLLIAAHARHINATLVTGNEREFRRVPGLSVQNWLKP
jgi:tRNA(fMet)-specific endonuclease VapC